MRLRGAAALLAAVALMAGGCGGEPDGSAGRAGAGATPPGGAVGDVDEAATSPSPSATPAGAGAGAEPDDATTAWEDVALSRGLIDNYPGLVGDDLLLRPQYTDADASAFRYDDDLVLVEPVADLDVWRDALRTSLLDQGAAPAGEPWPGGDPVLRGGIGNFVHPSDPAYGASMTYAGAVGGDADAPDGYVVLVVGYEFDPRTGAIMGGEPGDPIAEVFTLAALDFDHDPQAPEPDLSAWSPGESWTPPEAVASLDDAVAATAPQAIATMSLATPDEP